VLTRQKIILSLLKGTEGLASKLALTKWAFLLAQETPSQGGETFYQFVPYHYGPYSFSLAQEISVLIRDGLIDEPDNKTWRLTQDGFRVATALPAAIERDIADIIRKHGATPLNKLIDSIYARYPWFTANSRKKQRRAQARPIAEPAVHTLGYEGSMVDGFLNKLVQAGIQCLIDVRNNPVSRRYGFHKSTLSRLCNYLEIEYHHFPELGIPSESRACLHVLPDYQKLFDRYQREMLPRQTTTLQKVAKILEGRPGALVCMEADPKFCHRSNLATVLSKHTGLPIRHLTIA
jgi:uncharacterized protein (DUF488 family)